MPTAEPMPLTSWARCNGSSPPTRPTPIRKCAAPALAHSVPGSFSNGIHSFNGVSVICIAPGNRLELGLFFFEIQTRVGVRNPSGRSDPGSPDLARESQNKPSYDGEAPEELSPAQG